MINSGLSRIVRILSMSVSWFVEFGELFSHLFWQSSPSPLRNSIYGPMPHTPYRRQHRRPHHK